MTATMTISLLSLFFGIVAHARKQIDKMCWWCWISIQKIKLRRLHIFFPSHILDSIECVDWVAAAAESLDNSRILNFFFVDGASDKLLIDEIQCMWFLIYFMDPTSMIDSDLIFFFSLSSIQPKRETFDFLMLCTARETSKTSVFNESSTFHRRRVRLFMSLSDCLIIREATEIDNKRRIWILIFIES